MDATVLVVTAEGGLGSLLTSALGRARYQVYTAPDENGAMYQLGMVKPDLVIVDLGLPDRGGWQTLERMRELSAVPIIAIADEVGTEPGTLALELGADSWLPQPVAVRELCARIRALLRRISLSAGDGSRHAQRFTLQRRGL